MAKEREFEIGQSYDPSLSIGGAEAVKDTMESIADSITNESFTKILSEDEIIAKQKELSTTCILINEIEIEKKEAMDEFKLQLKEPNAEKAELLHAIKYKSEERVGNLYHLSDQENGFMYIFDEEGICVDSRLLKPTERQLSIKHAKTGTDGE